MFIERGIFICLWLNLVLVADASQGNLDSYVISIFKEIWRLKHTNMISLFQNID